MKSIPLHDDELINKIFLIRGQKVMLDRDLANLYQVETRVLNQAVRRNIARFPKDFMFQLNGKEFENLKSQFATSNWEEEENVLLLLLNKVSPCFQVYSIALSQFKFIYRS